MGERIPNDQTVNSAPGTTDPGATSTGRRQRIIDPPEIRLEKLNTIKIELNGKVNDPKYYAEKGQLQEQLADIQKETLRLSSEVLLAADKKQRLSETKPRIIDPIKNAPDTETVKDIKQKLAEFFRNLDRKKR